MREPRPARVDMVGSVRLGKMVGCEDDWLGRPSLGRVQLTVGVKDDSYAINDQGFFLPSNTYSSPEFRQWRSGSRVRRNQADSKLAPWWHSANRIRQSCRGPSPFAGPPTSTTAPQRSRFLRPPAHRLLDFLFKPPATLTITPVCRSGILRQPSVRLARSGPLSLGPRVLGPPQ